MGVYVGLDCGGSSSRVLAMDAGGEILFQGSSGAANILSTPEHRLRRNLQNATRGCPQGVYVCGCFAGLINDETRRRAETILLDLFPLAKVKAEPDYAAAFFASPVGTDVCVIAGTGSLVCSWDGKRIVKSGGRGYIIGDQGSGYQFGRDALVAFLDEPQSASRGLIDAVETSFGATTEPEIIQALYRSNTPAMLLAKLMKPLGADALAGKPYALASVDRNMRALAEVVVRHLDRNIRKTDVSISLAGGVWKAAPVFVQSFESHLAALAPSRTYEVRKIVRPPLHGAVALAKELSRGN